MEKENWVDKGCVYRRSGYYDDDGDDDDVIDIVVDDYDVEISIFKDYLNLYLKF